MTFKPGRKFYLIIIICTFLWNQQSTFLSQKIAVENSYRDKLASAISRLVGIENFIIIVNIEMLDGTLKKIGLPQSKQSSSNSYTPIPGLPTLPSREKSKSGTLQEGIRKGKNDYIIGIIKRKINLIQCFWISLEKQMWCQNCCPW